MNLILTPKTEWFHHFIIRSYITDEDDYEIMESIGSGVRHGRLSWYKVYEVYRLDDPDAVGRGPVACQKFSRYGRAPYDFVLFTKLLAGVVRVVSRNLVKEHRLRKIHCAELPYARDDHFVCTETVYEVTYLMGDPILPWYVVSLPPAIQEVINSGKLICVTEIDPVTRRRLKGLGLLNRKPFGE